MQDQVFSLSAMLKEADICCLWILDIIHFSFTCAFFLQEVNIPTSYFPFSKWQKGKTDQRKAIKTNRG